MLLLWKREREEDPLEVKWGVTAEEAEAIAFLLGPVVPPDHPPARL